MIKNFLYNLFYSKGSISMMRFGATLCYLTACYISIILAYGTITYEGVSLVTSLLVVATGGKVMQKKYEQPLEEDTKKANLNGDTAVSDEN